MAKKMIPRGKEVVLEPLNVRVPKQLQRNYEEYLRLKTKRSGGEKISKQSLYTRALTYWWNEVGKNLVVRWKE